MPKNDDTGSGVGGTLKISPGGVGLSMKNMLACIPFDPYNSPKGFPASSGGGGGGGGKKGPKGSPGSEGPTGAAGWGNVKRVFSRYLDPEVAYDIDPEDSPWLPFQNPAYELTLNEETKVWAHWFVTEITTGEHSPPYYHATVKATRKYSPLTEYLLAHESNEGKPYTANSQNHDCAMSGFRLLPSGVYNIQFSISVYDWVAHFYQTCAWIDLIQPDYNS